MIAVLARQYVLSAQSLRLKSQLKSSGLMPGAFCIYAAASESYRTRKERAFLEFATQRAILTKRVVSGFQTRLTVPMGPLRCFAMMTSASFGCSVSLL